MTRRRVGIVVGGLLIIVVAAAVAIFIFLDNLRNTPIVIGTSEGEIAFTSNRDGDWDIYALNLQDASTRLLTGEGGTDFHVSWALDGTGLSFLSDRLSDDIDLALVDPQGEELQTLSQLAAALTLIGQGRVDWDPEWSPDGSQIAWVSLRDLNPELYVMDAGGVDAASPADITRLTNGGDTDFHPAWSPDGTQLAYASQRQGLFSIYVRDMATGKESALTDNKFDDLNPAWSLDGTQILFTSEREARLADDVIEFYIMDADGGNLRPVADDTVFEGDAVWSPNGDYILYMSNVDGDWDIYLMNADGSDPRPLTENDADDIFPVWRP